MRFAQPIQAPKNARPGESDRHKRTSESIRVVVADDHPIFRHGIRGLLEGEADITLVGEAADGYEAIDLGLALTPDVLIIDTDLPAV
ncbi:MAG TPA: response regulator transcription factor, partial [Chloroflexota bacterium]|nr:response regulator transcription factor [Chloroflexota bacterium]